MISHGDPAWGECGRVTHLAAPHTSAFANYDIFVTKSEAEVRKGWAEVGFNDTLGLSTWPARITPSSIAFRADKTAPRLCNDLSWPKPDMDASVESPNDAQRQVLQAVKFARISYFCAACAVLLVSGAPIKVFKLDLVAAYKRSGLSTARKFSLAARARYRVCSPGSMG